MSDPVAVIIAGRQGPSGPLGAMAEENFGTVGEAATITPDHATKTHGRVYIAGADLLTVALGAGNHLTPREYTLLVWAATPDAGNFTVSFPAANLEKNFTVKNTASQYVIFKCRFSPNQNAWTVQQLFPSTRLSPVTFESLGAVGAGAQAFNISRGSIAQGNLVVNGAASIITVGMASDPEPFRYLILIEFTPGAKVGSTMTLDFVGPFNYYYDPDAGGGKIAFTGSSQAAIVEIYFNGGAMWMKKISDP